MKCAWLYGMGTKYCTAVEGLVIPSCDELRAFCENENHHICPVFCAQERYGRRISLCQYRSIFSRDEQKGEKIMLSHLPL